MEAHRAPARSELQALTRRQARDQEAIAGDAGAKACGRRVENMKTVESLGKMPCRHGAETTLAPVCLVGLAVVIVGIVVYRAPALVNLAGFHGLGHVANGP